MLLLLRTAKRSPGIKNLVFKLPIHCFFWDNFRSKISYPEFYLISDCRNRFLNSQCFDHDWYNCKTCSCQIKQHPVYWRWPHGNNSFVLSIKAIFSTVFPFRPWTICPSSSDGSGSKIFDPGRVNFLWLGSGRPFMVWVRI